MRIGLSVYNIRVPELMELASVADELGFDSLWLGEHVVLPVGYTTGHPTSGSTAHQHDRGPIIDPNTHLLDPLVALSACAARTQSIDLATGIYLVPLRPPLVSARMIHTLHQVSSGRLKVGAGAGWLEEEFAAVGVPFDGRGRRLAESVEVMRKAWAGGPFSHHGEFFDVDDVQLCVEPVHIPVIFGGNTEGALRRAASLGDGWFSSGTPSYDDACRLRDRLLELREGGGDFTIYMRAPQPDADLLAAYDRAGFDRIVFWADQLWPAGGSPDEKRRALSKAADALGVTA